MDHLHQSRTLISVLRCLILPHITMPEIISVSAHFTLLGAKLSSSTKFGLFSFTPWTVLILFTCLSIQAASAFPVLFFTTARASIVWSKASFPNSCNRLAIWDEIWDF